jgi:putative transcriptional regulator
MISSFTPSRHQRRRFYTQSNGSDKTVDSSSLPTRLALRIPSKDLNGRDLLLFHVDVTTASPNVERIQWGVAPIVDLRQRLHHGLFFPEEPSRRTACRSTCPVLRVLADAFPFVIVRQLPEDGDRPRGQRQEMGRLVRVGRLPFPELERLGPEPGVLIDGGPQRQRDTGMKNEMFTELLGSAHGALEHAQGKRNLRTTTLPPPPKPLNGRAVKRLRATLHASQAVFARYLNVSTKLVQAWEANRRNPEGPALVLLHIAAEQPAVLERVRHNMGARNARHRTTASRAKRQVAAAP